MAKSRPRGRTKEGRRDPSSNKTLPRGWRVHVCSYVALHGIGRDGQLFWPSLPLVSVGQVDQLKLSQEEKNKKTFWMLMVSFVFTRKVKYVLVGKLDVLLNDLADVYSPKMKNPLEQIRCTLKWFGWCLLLSRQIRCTLLRIMFPHKLCWRLWSTILVVVFGWSDNEMPLLRVLLLSFKKYIFFSLLAILADRYGW
jgi:hypothetical protein